MKNFKLMFGSFIGLLIASVSTSYAAVDAAVTTALTDAKTDSVEVAGAVLVVLVSIAAFKYIKKTL